MLKTNSFAIFFIFFLCLSWGLVALASPQQFYGRDFVLPAKTPIYDEVGQKVQFDINATMIIESHSMQNGELVYQFRQARRNTRYFLRADELKKISGMEDCDVPMPSGNARNIQDLGNALRFSPGPSSRYWASYGNGEDPEIPSQSRFSPSGPAAEGGEFGERMAQAAYEVAGLCTNTTARYRDLDYVRGRIAKGETCRSRPGGKCYAAVKAALRLAGVTDEHLDGASAKHAHTKGILTAAGFRNINCDPNSPPLGAILVFSGGRHGHIEIYSGPERGYCSDFCRDEPISA